MFTVSCGETIFVYVNFTEGKQFIGQNSFVSGSKHIFSLFRILIYKKVSWLMYMHVHGIDE